MMPRIASLVPSLTELLFDLGLGAHLVARTAFCVHPRSAVGALPKVGGTKDVRLDRLRELQPTHVLVNVDENRLDTVERLREFVPRVIVTHPCAPRDNLDLLQQMVDEFGECPGVATAAARWADALRDELAANDAFAARAPAADVLYLIWYRPWMTVARDTYIARMLATVGWRTLPALDGGASGAARYPVLQGDEPWLGDVRRVLLPSEPFRFGPAHAAPARALCPAAVVQTIDGEMTSWYGSRAVQGLRYLRELAAASA